MYAMIVGMGRKLLLKDDGIEHTWMLAIYKVQCHGILC